MDDDDEDFILPHKSITATSHAEHVYKVKSEVVVENNIYICTVPSCLAKFSDALKLKIHRTKHYPKNCRCPICDMGHPDDQSFRNHQTTYHNLQPDGSVLEPLKCHKCYKISKDSKALRRHIIESHRPTKFPCHLCSFEFTRPENLRVHLKSVHNDPSISIEDQKEFKCTSCPRSFKEKTQLRKHIREHHRDTGTHKCCDKEFKNIFAYKRHQKYLHGPNKLAECKVCGVVTDGRHESRHAKTKFHQNALKRKEKKNSEGENGIKIKKEDINKDVKPEIQTETDNDSYSDENDMESELDDNKDVKKMCQLCQKPIMSKHLEKHKISAYHLRRVKIEKEKKKMDQKKKKEILPEPQKVSVTIDKDYDFACKICKMEFTTKGMLKSHLKSLSHLKIYNFLNNPVKEESIYVIQLGCSVCDLTFKYQSDLTTHLGRKYHLDKMKSLQNYKQDPIDDQLVITKVQSLPPKPKPVLFIKNCHVFIENLDLNIVAKCIEQNDYGPIIKNIKSNSKSKSNQTSSKLVIQNCHNLPTESLDYLAKKSKNVNYQNSTVEELANQNDDIVIKEEDTNYDIIDTDPSSENQISLHYCMYCNSPYRSLAQVQDHESKCVKLRESRRSYKCPTCFEIFTSKSILDRHTTRVHTSPTSASLPKYKCNFCDQNFKSKEHRTRHENRMHLKSERQMDDNNSKPKPRFDCCGKSYANIKCYKAHIDGVHLQIKHPCSQCNHISRGRKSLLQHIQNKHGQHLYHCKVCNVDFHHEKRLAEHLGRKRHLALVKGVKYYRRNI